MIKIKLPRSALGKLRRPQIAGLGLGLVMLPATVLAQESSEATPTEDAPQDKAQQLQSAETESEAKPPEATPEESNSDAESAAEAEASEASNEEKSQAEEKASTEASKADNDTEQSAETEAENAAATAADERAAAALDEETAKEEKAEALGAAADPETEVEPFKDGKAEVEEVPSPEEKAAEDAVEEEEKQRDPDVDNRAGYIPGYKQGANLSLSPSVPRYPAQPGGFTTPYFAPAPDDDWQFRFSGFASASLRFSSGQRSNPAEAQNKFTMQQMPRIPDFYGGFQGTNVTPGGWVDLHFMYGKASVQSHVTLTTWKQTNSAGYVDPRSQNWVTQAYLLFNADLTEDISVKWTVGSFINQYGGLGQYGAGQYNTIIIGMPQGVGENLALQYDISPEYSLYLEHGIMGKFGKAPANSGPTPFDAAQRATNPSSWVNHAHVGIQKHGEIPLVLGFHYLTNWSQDERDQIDNPHTYWIDEKYRPDGRQTVLGVDLRMLNNQYGNFALAVAHNRSRDAALLEGMGFFGAVSGEEATKRFLGQQGGGNGSMWVAGFEYNLSWAKLLYHPEPYWGEGPDLVTSVFSNAALINSEDKTADGRKMLKFGTEITYRFLPWVGVSGRYDHVIPNSKDMEETFDVISPKLLFKSSWITHEQVTLSYTKWFYGKNTHAEFPYEMPRSELDDQMFALHFGMWW